MTEYRYRVDIYGYEKATWPAGFAFPPRVGDYVRSQGGTERRLRVVAVTHEGCGEPGNTGTPGMRDYVVMLELHR